jgi:hypothetical protein
VIYFVYSDEPIAVDHLRYLVEHFERESIPHEKLKIPVRGDQPLSAGDCFVTCDHKAGEILKRDDTPLFEVLLAHNLTGVKGANFISSRANLNVLGGSKIAEVQDLDLADPRYVVGGYPKWDFIYRERFRQDDHRQEIARQLDMDPNRRWVCFYPTGPNDMYRGNLGRTLRLFERAEEELEGEFVLCNHARNRGYTSTRSELDRLHFLCQDEPFFHIVDGKEALRFIAACDLFITDFASTLISALSMKKPVAFVRGVPRTTEWYHSLSDLQCGVFVDDIEDLNEFMNAYEPTPELRELFERCVAFDDDRNCERVADLIRDRYEQWRGKNGFE